MQDWSGTYTIDSTCNTTVCCCFTGQAVFTNYTDDTLGIFSNIAGQCSGDTTFTVDIKYPNGYTSSFLMNETTIYMTLDTNTQSVAFVDNTNLMCNNNAIKYNHSIKQQIDIIILFPFILIILINNII